MNTRKLTVLTVIAGILALGEFGTAVMIGLGRRARGMAPVLAVLFGVFFLIAAWLLRSGRITAGAVFAGLLCLVEVPVPHLHPAQASDWMYETGFALVSLAGLIGAIAVLAGRRRSSGSRGLTRRSAPARRLWLEMHAWCTMSVWIAHRERLAAAASPRPRSAPRSWSPWPAGRRYGL